MYLHLWSIVKHSKSDNTFYPPRYKLHERAARCLLALGDLDRAEAEALQALARLSEGEEAQQRPYASCSKLLEDIRGQIKVRVPEPMVPACLFVPLYFQINKLSLFLHIGVYCRSVFYG